uniref:peroxidase n=1 Tax=Oryza barthii TaxID=65489 RepID=A0A0D3GUY2_9ORYZ
MASSLSVAVLLCLAAAAAAQLSPTFYDTSCPRALATIKSAVTAAVNNEARMGASLLRLHFHDCFGCDASVLLADTATFTGEQNALPNKNSLRGFNVIDSIKTQLEGICSQTVSCADILAVAARDSVVALGGPSWTVGLGRRDSTTASMDSANNDLPPPFFDLENLIKAFGDKGFSVTDMVALSGAHTIGQAQCTNFRGRIYNETNIDAGYAAGATLLLSGQEQNAGPNVGSLRGFSVIDNAKARVEAICNQTVSCADILAVAARDSVVALGGPSWTVLLGRRDSTTASEALANTDLPAPSSSLAELIGNFSRKGLDATDMVALSGAHTIGQAQCQNFRDRLYNETNIDSSFATALKANCPRPTGSGDSNLAPLDTTTPNAFDSAYYTNLLSNKGLLHSDQVLFNGGSTDNTVRNFSSNTAAFNSAFTAAMVKMGNISPLTGTQGQIRLNCSKCALFQRVVMASASSLGLLLMLAALVSTATAHLSPTFYDTSCPRAMSIIKSTVTAAVNNEPRMGASLLRLHFHDCFVQARRKVANRFACLSDYGCDASILLAGNERNAAPNFSVRGYDVIDSIKTQIEAVCKQTVSCADILTVAARDSVVALGGPSWSVPLGRRDSTGAATAAQVVSSLAPSTDSLAQLISAYASKGLSATDLVALSGAHTIGMARCRGFRTRLYNETNIDAAFAAALKANCPATPGSGDGNLAPLDTTTPNAFDNAYYRNLLSNKGLLHSDQELFSNGSTDNTVRSFASSAAAFGAAFATAMVKMGNISPLTGTQGQIRLICSAVNSLAMASAICISLLVVVALASAASAQLSATFYDTSCPRAMSIIKSAVTAAVNSEPRMGASLLRLHFHDCFGCDASVLLSGNEQDAAPNKDSLRGFGVIDNIKTQIEAVCNQTVSCADILTVAARDSVVALGGPSWSVPLGRRDSTGASAALALSDLPPFTASLQELVDAFAKKGLSANCPRTSGDMNLAPLDTTTANAFDNAYYTNLLSNKGLLHSDQVLFNNGSTDNTVRNFASNAAAFSSAFATAMVNMGNIAPKTGTNGQIRLSCSKVNS